MNANRVILHPTDFSERSAGAGAIARDLARDRALRLILLHVVPVIAVPHLGRLAPIEDPEAVRERLDAMRTRLAGEESGVPIDIQVCLGDPASEIIQSALDLHAEFIVMGTHGRSGLRRILLGSVAEMVMRLASCPVLAVRDGLNASVTTDTHRSRVNQA